MFFFKKLISPLFFPLQFSFVLLSAGIAASWFLKRKRLGNILLISAWVWVLVLGNYQFASMLLAPLESQYPPLFNSQFAPSPPPDADYSKVRFIVVLAGGHFPGSQLPLTNHLQSSSQVRLLEGVRLSELLPNAKLLLSGGGHETSQSEAQTMSWMAEALHVDKSRIVLETESRDTFDQAELVSRMIGSDPFILVTSANHMPRSVALFKKQGASPIAAPTDFQVVSQPTYRFNVLPSAGALALSEFAIYEYLGLAWSKLSGKI